MRDANYLMIATQDSHFGSDRVRDFTAHIRVDLIKNEQRNCIMSCQSELDREHQARDFATRSDRTQRFQRLARIRGEKQFNGIESVYARFVQRTELCFEIRLTKTKIDKVLPDRCRKFWRRFGAEFPQCLAGATHLSAHFFDFAGQAFQLGMASYDFAHPLRSAFSK